MSNLSKPRLWLAAIKPPMYSVAIMPILVGTAIAYSQTHTLDLGVLLDFLLAGILILAWENLCNDLFDADTGIDLHKAHSVVNLTGKKALVQLVANLCLLAGLGAIAGIAWQQQDLTVVGLILLCCALGYVYQGPPFRWGYQGWGELLCFVSFGPVALSAAYYSQVQAFSGLAIAASPVVGVATSLILYCSHFNQVTDDQKAGKRSPVVQLGTQRAASLLPWICAGIYGVVLAGIGLGYFPAATALSLLGIPIAFKLCTEVMAHHDQEQRLASCRFIAVGLHFCTCLGFGLGFIL
ncbi:MAG: 2-carboxy-1,4-naphthoquinone phytyltransferase [Pseudanabaenaceae cyanobacterium bins.68]|nr:2-carboxy-1,4-naphthoquinone phytyltransferase [Pseudanabaenaceae cyanobacterium bins.68]